jgi:hypothetical protein
MVVVSTLSERASELLVLAFPLTSGQKPICLHRLYSGFMRASALSEVMLLISWLPLHAESSSVACA